MQSDASSSTMKALRLTREEPAQSPILALSTLPKPQLIPNHVLVKVHASAIHPSDVLNARGLFPYTQYPRVVGRDYAGVIVDGPPKLVGMEVYGTSGHTHAFTTDGFQAEYCLVPEDAIAEKPKSLTFAQAAAVGVPFTTAAIEIERAAPKPTDTVLVIGANGAVGSAATQLARNTGARILTATRNDKSDVNTAKDPEFKTIDALTDGRGINVIIDTVGSPVLINSALKKLARGGRLAFISAQGADSPELNIDMRSFYRADLSIHGCNSLNSSEQEMAKQLNAMRDFFDTGKLITEDNWTKVSLDEAETTYRRLLGGADKGKYIIIVE